jgi:hypothetical protein
MSKHKIKSKSTSSQYQMSLIELIARACVQCKVLPQRRAIARKQERKKKERKRKKKEEKGDVATRVKKHLATSYSFYA